MSNLLLESGFKQEEVDHYNELKTAGFNDEEIVDYDRKTSMGYTDEQIANEARANRMMDSVVSGNSLVDDLIAPETRVAFEKLVRYSNNSDEFRDTMSELMYMSLLSGIHPTQLEPMLDTVNENVLGLPARPHEAWQTIVKAYEDGYKRRYGHEIKKVPGPKLEAIQGSFANGPMGYQVDWPTKVEYDYTTHKLERIPINIGKTLFEVPKAATRFLEQDIAGTANTVGWWMAQIVEYGGVAVDKLSKLGSKNPDQIYNPLAEAIISTAQSIKANTEEGRANWEYAAMTGWEAFDEDLKTRDPISYAVGRLTQSSMSSGLAVLAAYLGGPEVGLELLNTQQRINQGLLLLSGISAAGAFEHAKAQKENFFWSTMHGLADGMIEYYSEKYFLQDIGKGRKNLAWESGKQEMWEELFAETLQGTRKYSLENINKGMSTYEAVKKGILQMLPDLPWALAGGWIGGYGMGTGTTLVETVNKWVKMGEAMTLPEGERNQFLRMAEQRYQQLDEKRRAAGEIPTLGQKVLKQSEALTNDEIKELNFLEENRGDIVALYNHYQKPEESQFIRNVRRQMGGIRPISEAPAETGKGEITSIIRTEAEGHVEDKSRLSVVKENVPAEQIEGLDLKADEWAAKWQKATDEFIGKHPELTPEQKRDVVHSAFTGVDETGFEGGGELAKDLHDNYLMPASKKYIKSKVVPAEVATAPGAKDELARLQDRSRELSRKTYFLTEKEQKELDKIDEQIETLLTEREAAAPKFGIRAAAPGEKFSIEAVQTKRDEIVEKGEPDVIEALKAVDEYFEQPDLLKTEVGIAAREVAGKFKVDTSEVLARLYNHAIDFLAQESAPNKVQSVLSLDFVEFKGLQHVPTEDNARRVFAQIFLKGVGKGTFNPMAEVVRQLGKEKPGGITGYKEDQGPKPKALSLESLTEEGGEIIQTKGSLPLPIRNQVEMSFERMAEDTVGHNWPVKGSRRFTVNVEKQYRMTEDMLIELLKNKKPFSILYKGEWIEIPASPLTSDQIAEIERLEGEAARLNIDPYSYVWQKFLKDWQEGIIRDEKGRVVVQEKPLEQWWDRSCQILNRAATRLWELRSEAELAENPTLRQDQGVGYNRRQGWWRAGVTIPGERPRTIGGRHATKEAAIATRRQYIIDRYGADYHRYDLSSIPKTESWPSYTEDVSQHALDNLKPQMVIRPVPLDKLDDVNRILEEHQGASYTGKNSGVVFSPGQYPPNPAEDKIIENIGAEAYNEKYGKNFKIGGETYYDGSTDRLISEIFSEGAGRPRVLAEEIYHPIFYIIRETDQIEKVLDDYKNGLITGPNSPVKS